MITGEIPVKTERRSCFVDITSQVQSWLREMKCTEGHLIVFVPHTTAGITLNENADPDVQKDLTSGLGDLCPREREWTHSEGNSDAHLKSSLVGSSLALIVKEGKMQLGTWQAVYFLEGDGPRSRKVWLSFVGDGRV